MRAYRRLCVRLAKGDREKLDDILKGGIQAVRVVLRALALWHLHEGRTVSETAGSVRLTPKAVREIGRRYQDSGVEQALYDKQRPGAASLLEDGQRQRIIAMVCSDPPEGRAPLDGAVGGPGGSQAQTGPPSGEGNRPDSTAPPRSQTVAGKKCGASPT